MNSGYLGNRSQAAVIDTYSKTESDSRYAPIDGVTGATGGTGNPFVYEHDNIITEDYTITKGKNAVTGGDVLIPSYNALLYSEQLNNAVWTTTAAAVSADDFTDPDSVFSADVIIPDTATSTHYIQQAGIALDTQKSITACCHFKSFGYSQIRIQILDDADPTTASFLVDVDLTLLTAFNTNAAGTGEHIGYTITPVANGYYRISVTGYLNTESNAARMRIVVMDGNSATFTGDGINGVIAWGAQIQNGYRANDYVQTTTTIADGATITVPEGSTWTIV